MDTVAIGSLFMKDVVSKILNIALKKKLGCALNVQLNDFNITFKDKNAHLHLDIDCDMMQEELKKLLVSFGLG